jgi:hypothetical protein
MNKEFVNKNLKNWNDEAISELGEEEGKDCYLYMDSENARIEEIDEENGELHIACETSKLGYISLDVELRADDLLDLIEIAVKKLNKFKTVLEGLK